MLTIKLTRFCAPSPILAKQIRDVNGTACAFLSVTRKEMIEVNVCSLLCEWLITGEGPSLLELATSIHSMQQFQAG